MTDRRRAGEWADCHNVGRRFAIPYVGYRETSAAIAMTWPCEWPPAIRRASHGQGQTDVRRPPPRPNVVGCFRSGCAAGGATAETERM